MQPLQRIPQVDDIIKYRDPSDGKWCPAIVTNVGTAESVNLRYVNSGGTGMSATSVSRGGDVRNWDFVQYSGTQPL